eukprot:scaffold141685_cov139-Phaeocystis_antarctica.AAC.3
MPRLSALMLGAYTAPTSPCRQRSAPMATELRASTTQAARHQRALLTERVDRHADERRRADAHHPKRGHEQTGFRLVHAAAAFRLWRDQVDEGERAQPGHVRHKEVDEVQSDLRAPGS